MEGKGSCDDGEDDVGCQERKVEGGLESERATAGWYVQHSIHCYMIWGALIYPLGEYWRYRLVVAGTITSSARDSAADLFTEKSCTVHHEKN